MNRLYINRPVELPGGFAAPSASYAALKLIEQLAPSVMRDAGFEVVPGGIRLLQAKLDVILDAEPAGLLAGKHPLERYAQQTGFSVLLVVDTSFSVVASACIWARELKNFSDIRPWFDPQDPCLTMLSNARGPVRAGDEYHALKVHADAEATLERLVVSDIAHFVDGLAEAEARAANWRQTCNPVF